MLDEKSIKHIEQQKTKCGFAVAGGLAANGVSYAYTIGMVAHGLPELIVIGPDFIMCGALAHEAAHKFIEEGRPADEEVFDMHESNFALKAVTQHEIIQDMAPVAFQYNATLKPEQFAQLVLADENNLLPWQPGFNFDEAPHQTLLWQAEEQTGAPLGYLLH
jgi:hypothetical protein